MKKNNKPLIAIIALALVALIGTTIAYFSNSAEFENEFTTASYGATTVETFVSPTDWKPGETVSKTVVTTNTSSIPIAVRASYVEKWYDANNQEVSGDISGKAIINLANTSSWTKQGNYYYYNTAVQPNGTTNSFIESVTLSPTIPVIDTCTTSEDTTNHTKTVTCTNGLGDYKKYVLTITVDTVQYDQYSSVWTNAPTISAS